MRSESQQYNAEMIASSHLQKFQSHPSYEVGMSMFQQITVRTGKRCGIEDGDKVFGIQYQLVEDVD